MDENEEIIKRLNEIKAENEWNRANPENPPLDLDEYSLVEMFNRGEIR